MNELARREILAFGDTISPPQLVAWAKTHKASALYRFFEWDDKVAGEQYRLEQARRLIRLVLVVPEQSVHEIRGYFSLPSDRGGAGYRSLATIINDEDLRQELLDTVFQAFESLQQRYQHLKELAGIWDAIEEAKKKAGRRNKRDDDAASAVG